MADPESRKAAQSAFQAALNDAARNAASAWVLRALYSPDQLRERLTWFWFNRLNVHQGKSTLRAAVGDYVDTAIRPHVLGRFRDLLMASLRHPAMLRYLDHDANVSRALATYFLGQAPDDALVARLAAIFTRTEGDIAAVMEALIRDPTFAAAQTSAFKDPVRYVFSALRMAYDERVILNTAPVLGWLNRLGEGLFNRSTPDGYALDAAAWSGPGQLTTRFEIARQIGSGPAGLFKPSAPDRPEEPAFPVLANALYFSTLSGTLSAPTKGALAQAVSPQDWNTLYLASPEFMR